MSKTCEICGARAYSDRCFRHKERKPLKRTPIKKKPSKQYNADREFKRHYLATHPPDEHGYYTCYLQTTEMCSIRLLPEQVTLEHVIPKGSIKGRDLRHNEDNIKIACTFCNSDKGSQDLEKYLIKKRKSIDIT